MARSASVISLKSLEETAINYARSGLAFEEAAVRLFMGDSVSDQAAKLDAIYEFQVSIRNSGADLNPLRIYLLEVLKALPPTAKSQRAMVSIWIMELFLHQITSSALNGKVEKDIEDLRTQECIDFIRSNRISLDPATILQLIVSRDNRQLMLFFAKIIGDYHRVVSIFLAEKRYGEAISVLSDAPFEKVATFIYEVAPILIEADPESTIQLFLTKTQLSLSLLLPALLRYTSALDNQFRLSSPSQQRLDVDYAGNVKNFAIFYLEELLKGLGLTSIDSPETDFRIDPALRNYDLWKYSSPDPILLPTLGWLLAKYDNSIKEVKVCRFMQELVAMQQAQALEEVVPLDIEGLLRQCRIFHRRRSAVYVLLLLHQPLLAAEEALLIDVRLAKNIAMNEQDPDITRAIWLKIAQSIITTTSNMKSVADLIEESQNILSIEDLLPLLPDFTEIDLFKEQICNSLNSYGSRIQEVKAEMQELASTVESSLQELHGMKNRAYSTVSNLQRCEYCLDLLHQEQFYLFPCSHGFHSSCMVENAPKNLSSSQSKVLTGLLDSMKSLSSRASESDSRARAALESMQSEVDGLVAAECPLCGNAMIDSVSCSLLSEQDSKDALQWRL